jgi:transcriptional regulator with XRE-family HTH domain
MWREAQGWSQERFCDELARHLRGSARSPKKGTLSRWETGQVEPSEDYLLALSALGAPVDGWTGAAEVLPADDAAAEVQAALEAGRPLAEVYALAAKKQAAFLGSGLSPDRQRAWATLLRTLRDGVAERGRVMPLQEHPEWPKAIEVLLDGVAALPGGPQAVLAAARKLRGSYDDQEAAA